MTVLLVHLPVGFEEAYPLGLAALAGPLIAAGHDVAGLDVGRVGLAGLTRRLGVGDVDVLGLSVWSPAVGAARKVIASVRGASPGTIVVVGGPHPTLCPDDLPADIAIIGEGEKTFTDLVNTVATGEVSGRPIGVHQPGSGQTPERSEAVDLSSLAATNRSVFPITDYHRDHLPQGFQYASVVTSRGCTYQCAYCSTPAIFGRRHRFRDPEQIVSDWRRLKVDHGVDGLLVEDDLFTLNRKRVVALCEALMTHPPGVTWELLNGIRADSLDIDLVQWMAKAGCDRIAVGIETASEAQQSRLGRSVDPSHLRSVLEAAAAAGMSVTGYFMLGLPGESKADRTQTFELATQLPLDMAHFSQASAWPGTDWKSEDLVNVPPGERARYYAAYYLHPTRALRAARVLGVGPAQIPAMVGRLYRWMSQPLEARRASL